MEVSIDQRDGVVFVTPSGDVDMSNSPELQQVLRKELGGSPERVVVQLNDVPYMDSSGVATLVEAMQIARKQSTKLVLCGMQDRVRSIFEIARLDRIFTIVDTADEAASA